MKIDWKDVTVAQVDTRGKGYAPAGGPAKSAAERGGRGILQGVTRGGPANESGDKRGDVKVFSLSRVLS